MANQNVWAAVTYLRHHNEVINTQRRQQITPQLMEKMKNRENKKFGCQIQSGRGEAGGGGGGGGGRGREWKHNVEGHVLITKKISRR